jgi:EAL domain-containing protein (putative c-di-GMP-specific phosphodiesterase class I)
MSVNVSPRQFHQPDFVEQVVQMVRKSGAIPASIRLEITESTTIQNPDLTVETLERLRAIGVRVSIDDFGTGYSSLSYLHQFPLDTVKIDRSFVAALQEKEESHDIIRTILDLAKNLQMDVVAEGTETASDVQQLRDMGCGFAQGYYFSRPLDHAAATAFLAR